MAGGNVQPGRPASAMRDGNWRYRTDRLRRYVPMPLTGQQATITSVPNGTFAPNLYVTGKDSGTFMIMGGGISGMVGAFRLDGSKHMTTRTAPGADIEWTRTSSEAPMQSAVASQVMPAQIQWPLGDLPAIAQRATAYVRSKWQPDAFP